MPKCSFSGKQIPAGTGIMYVLKDGKILYFKSSKEKKNFLKLKRVARKVKWTEAYRKENQKGEFAALKKAEPKVSAKKEAQKAEEKPAVKEEPKVEEKAQATQETPAQEKKEEKPVATKEAKKEQEPTKEPKKEDKK